MLMYQVVEYTDSGYNYLIFHGVTDELEKSMKLARKLAQEEIEIGMIQAGIAEKQGELRIVWQEMLCENRNSSFFFFFPQDDVHVLYRVIQLNFKKFENQSVQALVRNIETAK
jgi:hypothetical protein